MVVVYWVFRRKEIYQESRVGCEDGSSRCGSTLQFSCFLHHAEVCDRNPVGCQFGQVVVDGVDDDRHWMRQYSAELDVQLSLKQCNTSNIGMSAA